MSGTNPDLNDEYRRLKRINSECTLLHLRDTYELECERRRITGFLHDQIAQPIIGARLMVEGLRRNGTIKDSEIENILNSIVTSVRQMTTSLNSECYCRNNPEEALYELGKACAQHFNGSCYMDVPCKLFTTPCGYHIVYQIISQMLNGTMGIYHADTVWVWIQEKSGKLEIMTVDNGTLFDIDDLLFPDESHSVPFLVQVEEEVRCLGGEMDVERDEDNKTVTIRLPLCMEFPE